MNSTFKAFLTIFFLGFFGALCYEAGYNSLGMFFNSSAVLSIIVTPIIKEMYE